MPKLAIVVSHPIQHFCPLYRSLAQSGAVILRVFFGSTAGLNAFYDPGFGQMVQFQSDLTDGFDFEFLPDCLPDLGPKGRVSNSKLAERLSAFDPDVVQIYGYSHPISRTALAWARRRKRAVLYCSDAELLTPQSPAVRIAKQLFLRWFFSRCDGFLTVGDCNEDYYRNYGVPASKFFRCPFPIDEDKLTQARAQREDARAWLRSHYGIPENAVVGLWVGKLTARKAPADAVEAIRRLWMDKSGPKPFLILAGSGPEKAAIDAMAQLPGSAGVRVAGYVGISDLPRYYAGADILVHTSSEDPHPLAISEGVFVGLPVIVSDRVGSVGPTDDVRAGVNGFKYPYGSVSHLERFLQTLCEDPARREEMSQASCRIGQERTLGITTSGYLTAVRQFCRQAQG